MNKQKKGDDGIPDAHSRPEVLLLLRSARRAWVLVETIPKLVVPTDADAVVLNWLG